MGDVEDWGEKSRHADHAELTLEASISRSSISDATFRFVARVSNLSDEILIHPSPSGVISLRPG